MSGPMIAEPKSSASPARPRPSARPTACPKCGGQYLTLGLDGWGCWCGWCSWETARQMPLPRLDSGRHSRGRHWQPRSVPPDERVLDEARMD